MNITEHMHSLGISARLAAQDMAKVTTSAKNYALLAISNNLLSDAESIVAANHQDLQVGKTKGLDDALLDRLMLNEERITSMSEGIRQIADLADPIGEVSNLKFMPSGIQVGKMRVPLGVIGMIYESRPNVTADAAALCLKSGNAVILRGGSEAKNSNKAIADSIYRGLESAGLNRLAVQVVETVEREAVNELITMTDFVDVIIPRGGKGLVSLISEKARVPVIKHLEGICHVYIDSDAELDKAFAIALNAKTHRYGVCNAMETLLVAEDIATNILPDLGEAYVGRGVELRGCELSKNILPEIDSASEEDWHTEYHAPVLSIKVVKGVDAAIKHINEYGSGHTDSIVTNNYSNSRKFLAEVDSSSVMVNASTRFADGFEYGLGAEIGISTDKIHVRGPVGLEGLTSEKNIVFGDGHIRK